MIINRSSYIGEEEVKDYYYQWMYENSVIDKAEYDAIVALKGLAEIIDEETYLAAVNSSGTRSVKETSVYVSYKITASGSNLTVSGTLTWTDSNGASHPLKQVRVEVVDEDDIFNDIVGTTYTSSTGTFSVTFANQTGASENGCDIFIRVYPASSNIAVKTTSNGNYTLYTPTKTNVMGSVATTYYILNPSNTARAFQIHQAGIVGAQYVKSLSGTAPKLLNFRYPYDDSGVCKYNDSYVLITKSYYYSWDVILHEYGHYIVDIYNIKNSPGGDHTITDNLIDTFAAEPNTPLSDAKDKGCRLAWSEGWATYFSISSQMHQNVSSIGVPGAGDVSYDDLYGGWSKNCETYSGRGEGNEMAVTCVLWDLADSPSWDGSTKESHDSLSLGYQTVWNYSVNSGAKTFSDFMKYVYSMLSSTNYRNVGSILAAQNITAKRLKTNYSESTNYYFPSDSAPTFSWTATSGSKQCVDNYSFQIYDTSMKLVFSASFDSGKTTYTYTLPNDIWKGLKTKYADGFYWCVRVDPSSTPTTGPYYSQFIRCHF